MLIDGRTVADGSHLSGDICIVGGGFTGLLLAEQLSALPVDIHVLESDDEFYSIGRRGKQPATWETTDALGIERSGTEVEPLADSRARALGGTAHIWNTFIENRAAARYLRMEAIDLELRSDLPHHGWPFGLETLNPYYDLAEAKVMPAFSLSEQLRLERSLLLDSQRVVTVAEGFGTADVFTQQLPKKVANQARVTVVTNATVTQISSNQEATVADKVHINTRPGRNFTLGFRVLILAAGAIENTRLLLASDQRRPSGLGNGNDLVGRFYMDHHRLNAGHLVPFDRQLFNRTSFFDLRRTGKQYWMGKLKLSESFMRERGLLNASTLLWPRPSPEDDRGIDALRELWRLVKAGKLGPEAWSRAREVVAAGEYLVRTGPELALIQRTASPNITRGGWSHLSENHRRFAYFELVQQVEQVPCRDNRLTLSAERDRHGVRLPRVSAHLSNVDLESARTSQDLLAEALEQCGIGRTFRSRQASFPDYHQTGGIHHHLGTTRMHIDPKLGVCDANARLHEVANVYVAGGSVFPTGGYANPSLTIAALTLRLGDHIADTHLKARSQPPPRSSINGLGPTS